MQYGKMHEYELNPGISDVTKGIIPRLLDAGYAVCQLDGEDNTWHIRKILNERGEVDPDNVSYSGLMRVEGPNRLFLGNPERYVKEIVETQNGVTPVPEKRFA